MANRLAASSSPYLLQHAGNPVDWWEWGTEAFAEAVRRDVPVLLSVGYAACHWCHVMAGESFEDEATAEVANARFVSIKVDREERPDVDAVYMRATTAMTHQGGWPMTVFLTPDGRPFHAGTYYPPTPRAGMPSFTQVLLAVSEAWQGRREAVEDVAGRLSAAIGRDDADVLPVVELPDGGLADLLPDGLLPDAVAALLAEEDQVHGGLGGAPKFPPSSVLAFLLREGSDEALGLASRTLRAMASSGMYDQVDGGFARYAVDAGWVVPHFEKMLYDNAQLARVYARWAVLSEDAGHLDDAATGRRVATETCDWMVSALGTDAGGLASALDADTPAPREGEAWPDGLPRAGLPTTSHGVEGLTYVWTPVSLEAALGADDAAWAGGLLGVTAGGTFEHGTSTARLTRDVWADGGEAARWRRVREVLRGVRADRPQPARDDKVVAAWDGLAVAALAETGALHDRPDLVGAAQRVAGLLLDLHGEADEHGLRLRRVSRDGRAGTHAGVLEDHGDVAAGLLVLHGVDGDPRWARAAEQLCDSMLRRFVDPGTGTWRDTAVDADDPALAAALGGPRPDGSAAGLVDVSDGAHPGGPSAATGALLHAAALTGRADLRAAAERALLGAVPLVRQAPRFAGWWLAVTAAALDGPREAAVVGAAGPERDRLHRLALRAPAPGLVVSVGEPGAHAPALLRDRPAVGGAATAYVCRGFVCDSPTTDPDALVRALARGTAGPQPGSLPVTTRATPA